MSVPLFVSGAAFELLGILLIAAPDLVPGALRLSRWTRTRWRATENRWRRRLGLPLRRSVIRDSGTMTLGMSVSGSSLVTHDPNASLQGKVDFLLRRDEQTQKAMNRLFARVETLEESSVARLDELRREVEARIEQEMEAAKVDFRTARLGGTVALVIGLSLTTIANFSYGGGVGSCVSTPTPRGT
jgi:hypothetical protein